MLYVETKTLYKAVKAAYIPESKMPKKSPVILGLWITPTTNGVNTTMTNLEDIKGSHAPARWDGSTFTACLPARALRDWLAVTRKYTDLIEIEFFDTFISVKADNTRAEFRCLS